MNLIPFPRLAKIALVTSFLIVLVGLLDYLTGYRLAFFVFYFLPVGYAAWKGGRLAGSVVAVVSASVWLALDLVGRHQANLPPVEWWNSGIRLLAFFAFALTFAWARELLNHERELSRRLQASLDQVQELSGLLPICAACKKIRNDEGYWQQIESYISTHSRAEFTHGICPECAQRLYPEYLGGQQGGEEGRKGKAPEEKPTETSVP